MQIYKKLIGNSAIFAIGNLGSNIITIILVPLYTYYLTTEEYGLTDIIMTTTKLVLPVISLSIFNAVLRFVMDEDKLNNAVITNATFITLLGSIIIILFYPLLDYFNILDGYLVYMFVILILQAFQSIVSQYTRGIGKIKIYAVNGILMALISSFSNIVLLIKYDMGIYGYLFSIIFSNIISIIFLSSITHIFNDIKLKFLDRKLIKEMIAYSMPLIPNALMWWIINASSRYFVLFFVGATANGLFAVANKIPSLLSILNSIFSQAWQLSAIEEYDSNNKSKFYSEIFSYFSMAMFISSSGIIMFLKIIMSVAVSPEFYPSWKFVPFLLLGVVFSSFASFLATNYIAAKKTNGVFRTSVIGGIINLVSNIIFVPLLGVMGAGISAMISFFAIWVMRIYDTKKFISMKLNIINISLNLFILTIQILVLYLNISIQIEFILELIMFIILLLINKSLFRPLNRIISARFK